MSEAWVVAATAVGLVLGALLMYGVAFSVRKKSEAELAQGREELKGQFSAVSAEVFRAATDQLLKLAESRLETERVRGGAELDERRAAVESAVSQLQERLKSYEALMREFEADRSRKYGSLEEQLRRSVQTTEDLRASAEGLRAVLSNSRARGQWGERMAEDILRAAGLAENAQYVRNKAQETSATRPDYTFFLPDGYKVHMDVKFPLDNYLRMANAAGEEEKARSKADFLKDVKARIKEIQKRDYVNPEEKTLGYVLLFIPNEQIYGFVLESLPGLIDESLAQKVVLVSPFSLYAVLAVIRQSFDNFYFSRSAQEMVKLLGSFEQAYAKFKERFEALGGDIEGALKSYREVSETSFRRLEQCLARIDKVRSGQKEDPVPDGTGSST